jgi:Glyoxalase/Bleomycin resistance protein/Dioxygenase superfamily
MMAGVTLRRGCRRPSGASDRYRRSVLPRPGPDGPIRLVRGAPRCARGGGRPRDHPGELEHRLVAVYRRTDYWPSEKQGMVNFTVGDLDAMLAQLRAASVDVDDKVEDHEYGRFGWFTDPEGNRRALAAARACLTARPGASLAKTASVRRAGQYPEIRPSDEREGGCRQRRQARRRAASPPESQADPGARANDQ